MSTESSAIAAPLQHPAAYCDFISFVRQRSADPGTRSRLIRSLRGGDKISDDAWWLLGAWLPADHDKALIMARVAAWASTDPAAEPVPWRTIAGEMAPQVSPETARRAIEGIAREGAPTADRLIRATRVIQQLDRPARIDWAKTISDFVSLTAGGNRAHAVRSRWYRDYFRNLPGPDKAEPTTDNNGKEHT